MLRDGIVFVLGVGTTLVLQTLWQEVAKDRTVVDVQASTTGSRVSIAGHNKANERVWVRHYQSNTITFHYDLDVPSGAPAVFVAYDCDDSPSGSISPQGIAALDASGTELFRRTCPPKGDPSRCDPFGLRNDSSFIVRSILLEDSDSDGSSETVVVFYDKPQFATAIVVYAESGKPLGGFWNEGLVDLAGLVRSGDHPVPRLLVVGIQNQGRGIYRPIVAIADHDTWAASPERQGQEKRKTGSALYYYRFSLYSQAYGRSEEFQSTIGETTRVIGDGRVERHLKDGRIYWLNGDHVRARLSDDSRKLKGKIELPPVEVYIRSADGRATLRVIDPE